MTNSGLSEPALRVAPANLLKLSSLQRAERPLIPGNSLNASIMIAGSLDVNRKALHDGALMKVR